MFSSAMLRWVDGMWSTSSLAYFLSDVSIFSLATRHIFRYSFLISDSVLKQPTKAIASSVMSFHNSFFFWFVTSIENHSFNNSNLFVTQELTKFAWFEVKCLFCAMAIFFAVNSAIFVTGSEDFLCVMGLTI